MSRVITTRYQDPLDLVWTETAARLGMRVVRSGEVYASWDGAGTLTLSSPDAFDPDDSLAQLILHELCHALVEGPDGQRAPDWGLCNLTDRDVLREHACQRLQCALATRWGLRAFFGSTTDFRAYYDALPLDPLADAPDPALEPARAGWARAQQPPWADALEAALRTTAKIVEITRDFANGGSVFRADAEGPLRA